MKISVLGLGYIGLPTAITLAMNGHQVRGFDTDKNVIESVNSGRLHIVEKGLQEELTKVVEAGSLKAFDTLQKSDVYIICVPTPFHKEKEDKTADLTYVFSAAEEVAKVLGRGELVILESTVPPYTTKKMTDMLCRLTGLGRDEFYTAHCPERVLPGRIIYEMTHNDRIIGAEQKEAVEKAQVLYESFLTEGQVYTTDDITAEMCKLVENSFRDVNIAFANELSIICDDLGIDVNELIALANRHPRVNILSPGVGVGGHCISVDPWFIIEKFRKEARLISAARHINDDKPAYIADKIEKSVKDKNCTIAVLGLAFKADIDDMRESPSVRLARVLMDKGYNVIGCEPNTALEEKDGIPIVPLDEALEADLVVLTVKHRQFIENSDKIKKTNCMIV